MKLIGFAMHGGILQFEINIVLLAVIIFIIALYLYKRIIWDKEQGIKKEEPFLSIQEGLKTGEPILVSKFDKKED